MLCDEREAEPKRIEYKYDGGIRQYVEYLNKNKTPLHEEVVYVEGIEDGILAEIAMQYNDGYIPSIYSFCNNINTMEGGTHEDGFRLALTRIINAYAREQGMIKKDETLAGDDVREGLTAIISVKHPCLLYTSNTTSGQCHDHQHNDQKKLLFVSKKIFHLFVSSLSLPTFIF